MAQNLILPFATGTGANVVSDQAWAVYAALAQGFQAGPAPSNGVNKALRQSTAVASGFGQFTADFSALDFSDSLSPQVMRDNFRIALAAAMDGARMGVDTSSTANTIAFPLTPLPPSLSGNKVIWFKPNLTNTGPATATILKADGTAAFTALPIKTKGGADPAAGDLVAQTWYGSTCDGATLKLLSITNSEIKALTAVAAGTTIYLGSATQGTATALTTTLANAPSSPFVGMLFTASITTTNGASPTIDFGYGAKPIVMNRTGAAITAGVLLGGVGYTPIFEYDGTSARVIGTSDLILPTGDVTIHVSTAGSDANGDGSAAKPFASIAYAATYAARRYFFAGYRLIIQLDQAGTYAAPGNLPAIGGQLVIQSDPVAQPNCIIAGAGPAIGNQGVVGALAGCNVMLSGLTVSNTGTTNNTIYTFAGGSITTTNVAVTSTGNSTAFAHFAATGGGSIVLGPGLGISGGMAVCLLASSSGSITIGQGILVSVTGNPNFGRAFAVAAIVSSISSAGQNAFGGSSTGPRYLATANGVISTGGSGPNYFPGSSAGSTDTGGQYV